MVLIGVGNRSALVAHSAGFSVDLVLTDRWNGRSMGGYKRLWVSAPWTERNVTIRKYLFPWLDVRSIGGI